MKCKVKHLIPLRRNTCPFQLLESSRDQMKHLFLRSGIILVLLLLGVSNMEASVPSDHWNPLQISFDHLEISFPRTPNHMVFDTPIENSNQQGQIHTYTSQLDSSLFMFSSIYSPLFNQDALKKDKFESVFYQSIIQRMFYQPQVFKTHKVVEYVETTLQNQPAIRFTYSYLDNHETQILSGLATYKNGKIFILFLLAPKNKFEKNTLKKFTDSFHFR